jgi:hypothetical protein
MAADRHSMDVGGKTMKKIKVRWDNMEMKDPLFAAGSMHTATANIPVSPAGLACTAELFLSLNGTTRAATSGELSFTSGNSPQTISFNIMMPSPAVGQSYGVYLVIISGGIQLAGYRASEDIIIPVVGQPTITW